jgi:DNA-3-methyladenine glycosylase
MIEGPENGSVLGRAFYGRATVDVARELIGAVLVCDGAAGRIVEVEAYLGAEDGAAHASRGLTRRTRVIFGPPGHAYVYRIYGLHWCLNLVAEPEGVPGCVLIRALEPVAGLGEMRRRREVEEEHRLCAGPGMLTQALGIGESDNGVDVTAGRLTVRAGSSRAGSGKPVIMATPRIGITKCVDWPLRFVERGSRFASRPVIG